MNNNRPATITHHITGDVIHEIIIDQTTPQSTIQNHVAAIQAQSKLHIIECVVETGALKYVAKFNHNAQLSSAENIM